MVSVPRLVIAAPGSGHGKTSIATGLLAALRRRGLTVSPHKVGPDYIDPSYHGVAAGRPGRNLDPWLVGEDRIVPLFQHGSTTPTRADIAIIEGVMGLFDGARSEDDFASTAHLARLLAAPVVLVVDASGVSSSVAALVHGFATFDPRVRLAGVIFNQVGSEYHAHLLRNALQPLGIAVLGVIRRQDELTVPSRHLGLIPAAERQPEAAAAVAALGEVVAAGVDLDEVIRIAATAGELPESDGPFATASAPSVRLAVAAGAAFTFGYAEHPELLAAAGAEVIGFDPLRDERLPDDVDGLVIGGGFPEVHALELSANTRLRKDIAALAASGAPVVGECAGLLYLGRELDGRPMCGVFDIAAEMTGRLTLGYRSATAGTSSPLLEKGDIVPGHEFHRTAVVATGAVSGRAWRWQARGVEVEEGFVSGNSHGSYLHTHWAGTPGLAPRLVGTARRFRQERTSG